jgi:DNA-binding transcriptional ArsR family regulator
MATTVQSDVTIAAQMFRSFGDPTRLAILTELLGGERRVVDLVDVLGCSQSNVSGHLACLKECGLIVDRPEGRSVHYRLATPTVVDLLVQAEALLGEIGERVELCENYRTKR